MRFAVTQRLERAVPGLCPLISLSTIEADFDALAASDTFTLVEAADPPFPSERVPYLGGKGRNAKLELKIALFEDAWVFGHTGQVVDARSNRSIRELSRGAAVPGVLRSRRLDGVAFSLITGIPGKRRNYYHYLTEKLPEHLAALGAVVEAFGRPTLLLPSTDHPLDSALVSEARRLFPELPTRRVSTWEKLRCEAVAFFHVSRFSNSPANRRILGLSIDAMRHSQRAFARNEPWRRLFVSRADARKRRLVNEDEVFARLEQFGFERLAPGRLPVADQIRLFSEAKVVAGAHGAGLTNLIFMPEGGSVVEIFRCGHVNSSYPWLAHLRGHRHGYVISDEIVGRRLGHYRLSGAALDTFERSIENLVL